MLGQKQGRGWDFVCLRCGGYPDTSWPATPPRLTGQIPQGVVPVPKREAEPSPWAKLLDYHRSCVVHESLTSPVHLPRKDRWAPFPLGSETVLCGENHQLPAPDSITKLFDDLGVLEGVWYGWPTVVVRDRRNQPHIAPLFLRPLGEPVRPLDGDPYIPVSNELPAVNTALLSSEWFGPDVLADAAEVIAGRMIGFGAAAAMTAISEQLLAALGIPNAVLNPFRLPKPPDEQDLWRPQELGVFNLVIAFKGELDLAVRGLVKDLDQMAKADDWANSAARFLFENCTPPAASPLEASPVRLNYAQEQAVSVATASPLTVITGPPGTGKSQTVTAIIAEAWRRGESVVLSSTNNKPVDDVVTSKAAQLDRAMVLRTGNAEKRRELGAMLPDLVAETAARSPGPGDDNMIEVAGARHWTSRDLQHNAELQRDTLAKATHRDGLRDQIWPHQMPPAEALPRIEKMANRVVRTRWRWLRQRRDRKFRTVTGLSAPTVGAAQVAAWFIAAREFDEQYRKLREFLHNVPGDLVARFHSTDQRWRHASETQLKELVRHGVVSGSEVLKRLGTALTEDEQRLDLMAAALRHAKGWATSALSTRPNFRCAAGSIDLVVIDEASQCGLAQILPLAYRAKRLVIVGDPQQLPPVVTADPGQLRWLAEESGSVHQELAAMNHTYGEDSAFSAFAARFQPTPLLLDEHYRCHPDIIRFCNQEFYNNQLKVLTGVDYPAHVGRGMSWHDVSGRTEPGRTGGVVNEPEAHAIVEWLTNADQLTLESVGVVTPFRAQANLIHRLIGDAGLHPIEVGTAHTFQGGERDTILFATVMSHGIRPGTVGWLESQRNLINVAVSRAKRQLIVFGDYATINTHRPKTLLALAEAARHPASESVSSPTWLAHHLHASLTARGIPARPGTTVEGYPVAIAITGRSGELIDVEIDEFPHGDPGGGLQRAQAVRDDNLRSLGWQVLRVPAGRCTSNPTRRSTWYCMN